MGKPMLALTLTDNRISTFYPYMKYRIYCVVSILLMVFIGFRGFAMENRCGNHKINTFRVFTYSEKIKRHHSLSIEHPIFPVTFYYRRNDSIFRGSIYVDNDTKQIDSTSFEFFAKKIKPDKWIHYEIGGEYWIIKFREKKINSEYYLKYRESDFLCECETEIRMIKRYDSTGNLTESYFKTVLFSLSKKCR